MPGNGEKDRSGWIWFPLAWFAIHTTVWIAGVRFLPGDDLVPYVRLGEVGTPWVRQFILPLILVLVLQAYAVRRLEWMREVLFETERRGGAAIWIAPGVILAMTVFAASRIGGGAPWHHYAGIAFTTLLVGTTEEVTFRGVLPVAIRRGGGGERKAFLVSSALFGFFHLPNLLIGGEGSMVLRQVLITAVLGTAFYALRRASGSLLPCIVLHAVYDAMLLSGV
jgi:membrane protease YdiL (CAAX protease family)